jgi:hypothetical protein
MSNDDTQMPEGAAMEVPRPLNFIHFTEGRVQLPDGYEDRTTNLLVPANPQTQPNLSIARDWMKADETLTAYVDRQLGLLKSQLASHKLLGRQPIRLGAPPDEQTQLPEEVLAADSPGEPQSFIEGERIDATYKSGKQTLYQRQAAFEVAALRVLVFTATSAQPLGREFDTLWNDWLASFNPAMPASKAEPGESHLGEAPSSNTPSTGA